MPKKIPDPNQIYPMANIDYVTNIKPTINKPNIIVGDYSYFSDVDFESHVTHHYEFYGDKLIIGKFCQIAKGVEFVMNGANHQMNSVCTFPFYLMGWEAAVPSVSDLPNKGDTIVGNDVWIGQNSTILPGVRIGDGAIIGANSVVVGNVEPYTVVGGNPAKFIRKKLNDELIEIMVKLQWWDLPEEEIGKLIPILTNGDIDYVKAQLNMKLYNRM
ncbi:MAG: CatB-related O-acetyltransferase [Clostridia bacterium]|nr:CatB-related O-acetyltransferase [Clostridia bacterium]